MLQGVQPQETSNPQLNSLLKQIGRNAWGLLPEVATDSTTISRNTLPHMYAQLYQNGDRTLMFFNVNNSITSIDVSGGTYIEQRTSDPTSPAEGRMWFRTDI